MSATLISFRSQPEFGFAHHTFRENSRQIQTDLQHSFVVVYVKSGQLTAKIYGNDYIAPAGSVLILFRHVPFELYSPDGTPQDYCSIQVYTDYTFSLIEDNQDIPKDFQGLTLPVVTPPGNEAESIKKDMYAIVSHLSISRETFGLYASVTLCGILSKLDAHYRQKLHKGQNVASNWEYKIKRYIADHISENISLQTLAQELGKTPNYINSVFSGTCGISIHQYINREKMRLIVTLMEMRGLTFQQACDNVGIEDISHGYRLFKKHMGITPKAYMDSEHLSNK